MRTIQIEIPSENIEKFLSKSISSSYEVKVDQLDCSKSFHRVPTDKSVEEVLNILLNTESHYVMIYRSMEFFGEDDYWDVGGSTMTSNPEYFLWIRLKPEVGYDIIKEFNLKQIPL